MESLYGDTLGAGALVDEWVIEDLVSRGGSGAVYRARDAEDKLVALKVLERRHAQSTSMLRRFRQELLAIGELAHPNIVSVLGAGALHDGRPYMVLEWLEGASLAEHLRTKGALSSAEVIEIGKQLGAALAAAHRAGIVHRDVKAENVVAVAADGAWRIKLVDFGIAKLLVPIGGERSVTTTTVLGTPATMAPEQILGGAIDARTDIYGLGVLLFQLSAGRAPFVATDPSALEQLHLTTRAPAVTEFAPVPPRLTSLIARCLEKEPRHRFASVSELLGELDRAGATGASSDAIALRLVAIAGDPAVVDQIIDDALATLDSAGAEIALETTTGISARWRAANRPTAERALECALAMTGPSVALSLSCEAELERSSLDAWPNVAGTVVIGRRVEELVGEAVARDPRLSRR